jgi:hypothetical protein
MQNVANAMNVIPSTIHNCYKVDGFKRDEQAIGPTTNAEKGYNLDGMHMHLSHFTRVMQHTINKCSVRHSAQMGFCEDLHTSVNRRHGSNDTGPMILLVTIVALSPSNMRRPYRSAYEFCIH